MTGKIKMVLLLSLITIALLMSQSSVSAGSDDKFSFKVTLTDEDNKEIETSLENITITFDTVTTCDYVKYYMRVSTQITIPPTNLVVKSDSGTFNSFVTITGLKSYLAESGIRMTISNGDQQYSADLTNDNHFTSYFNNSDAYAVLECNKPYSISMTTLGTIETTVPPEDIAGISFTFTVHMAKGNHQVMFISQDEVVDAYKAMDGYVIDKLPSVSRAGYDFKGWFLPDGREVTEGFVITENDADIIATAEWEQKEGLPIAIIVTGSIIGLLVIGGAVFFVIKKRRGTPFND